MWTLENFGRRKQRAKCETAFPGREESGDFVSHTLTNTPSKSKNKPSHDTVFFFFLTLLILETPTTFKERDGKKKRFQNHAI